MGKETKKLQLLGKFQQGGADRNDTTIETTLGFPAKSQGVCKYFDTIARLNIYTIPFLFGIQHEDYSASYCGLIEGETYTVKVNDSTYRVEAVKDNDVAPVCLWWEHNGVDYYIPDTGALISRLQIGHSANLEVGLEQSPSVEISGKFKYEKEKNFNSQKIEVLMFLTEDMKLNNIANINGYEVMPIDLCYLPLDNGPHVINYKIVNASSVNDHRMYTPVRYYVEDPYGEMNRCYISVLTADEDKPIQKIDLYGRD